MRYLSSVVRQPVVWAFSFVAFVVFVAACGGGGDDDQIDVTGDPEGTPSDEAPPLAFSEACQKSDEKQFAAPPDMIIDASKSYVATIKMANGDIVLELFSDVPITTNNFVFLACKGFYDGVTFHRVIPDFVAHGGDPTGSGSGGPGYAIPDEDDGDHTFEAGVISMAKSGPDTTGSQFFITYTPQPSLESGFTVFGRVIEGMDVVQQITPREGPTDPPGDVIETITIEER